MYRQLIHLWKPPPLYVLYIHNRFFDKGILHQACSAIQFLKASTIICPQLIFFLKISTIKYFQHILLLQASFVIYRQLAFILIIHYYISTTNSLLMASTSLYPQLNLF